MKHGEIINEAVFCGRIVSIRGNETSGTVTIGLSGSDDYQTVRKD